MEYLLKSGILYAQDQTKPLARIKSCFYSPEKQILSWDNTLLCRAQVQHRKGAPEGNAPIAKNTSWRMPKARPWRWPGPNMPKTPNPPGMTGPYAICLEWIMPP